MCPPRASCTGSCPLMGSTCGNNVQPSGTAHAQPFLRLLQAVDPPTGQAELTAALGGSVARETGQHHRRQLITRDHSEDSGAEPSGSDSRGQWSVLRPEVHDSKVRRGECVG